MSGGVLKFPPQRGVVPAGPLKLTAIRLLEGAVRTEECLIENRRSILQIPLTTQIPESGRPRVAVGQAQENRPPAQADPDRQNQADGRYRHHPTPRRHPGQSHGTSLQPIRSRSFAGYFDQYYFDMII
jgi:hypothetical protein